MTTATVQAAAATPKASMTAAESPSAAASLPTASPPPSPPPPAAPAPARRRPPAGRAAAAAAAAVDPLSDKATILLIRRTLCADDAGQPTQAETQSITTATATTTTTATTSTPPAQTSAAPPPIEELLPPLTSRNDVDLQLYGLLAVVVREFVQSWYGRITPDGQLATEIVHIFAHCTRALEQRLRRADLEGLVFDELPALLDNHVQAYRIAHQRLVPLPLPVDPRSVYHALLPLPALSPVPSPSSPQSAADQAANESAYRQLLVSGLLAVLLPTEDLDNECLTSLLGQILSELLLGSVLAARVAEPWMMWEIVGMLARLVREKTDGGAADNDDRDRTSAKPNTQPQKPHPTSPASSSSSSRLSSFPSPSSLSSWLSSNVTPLFWSALRFSFAGFASLRFLSASISLARSLPPRRLQLDRFTAAKSSPPVDNEAAPPLPPPPAPVLTYSLWPAIANLVELDVRMPWLGGCLSLLQWLALTGPARIGALDGPLDRLLSYYLRKYALDATLLPTLLRSLRAAVFPGNKFGATPPTLVAPANAQEEKALRRRTAEAVWAMAYGSRAASDAALADIDGVLDVFGDAYCNKHLLYGLLEAVLVRLMPEMAETGVLGLWEERLS